MTPCIRNRVVPAALLAALLAAPAPAAAQDNPFAGQTIELLSGYSDGAMGGIVLQAWGEALARQLPETRFVLRSNPGGTSALTMEMIATAPPDGLMVGSVASDALYLGGGAEMGNRRIGDFEIIASLNRLITVLFASKASGLGSLDELTARPGPSLMPMRSTVSGSYYDALFLNAMLGTRIRPVTGYDSGARDLAFATGEGDLITRNAFTGQQYVEDGTGIPLLAFADGELPALIGDIPRLSDLEIDPEFAWIPDFFNASAASTLIFAPRGIPEPQLQFLRDAFYRAASDPVFIAAIAPVAEVQPTHGAEVQADIDRLFAGFDDLDTVLARAMQCGLRIADTGEPCNP